MVVLYFPLVILVADHHVKEQIEFNLELKNYLNLLFL